MTNPGTGDPAVDLAHYFHCDPGQRRIISSLAWRC